MKTIALVGKTNVGKSTFFNRLVGKKAAIVHDQPGVTRDRKEGKASLGDISFKVIDTAGLEETSELSKAMWKQTEKAISDADIVLMMIDKFDLLIGLIVVAVVAVVAVVVVVVAVVEMKEVVK